MIPDPSDMSMSESFSLVRRLSQLGTRIYTKLKGVSVGQDQFGNRYYRERRTPSGRRESRWVIYAGEPEASKVPPEWHIWLHHMRNQPLESNSVYHQSWQKPYQPNQTGTEAAFRQPGHGLSNERRAKATGDYQTWKPHDE